NDNKLWVRQGNELKPANLAEKNVGRVRGMLTVRDAWRNVILKQEEGTEQDAKKARKLLNEAYDAFVANFGFLSTRNNLSAFAGDPDAPGLLSLENYDTKTKRATKADVFTK